MDHGPWTMDHGRVINNLFLNWILCLLLQQLLMSTGSPSGSSSMALIQPSGAISPTGTASSSSSSMGGGGGGGGGIGPTNATSPLPTAASTGGGVGGDVTPTTTTTSAGAPCCETGRPVVTDPVTGQSVCSCQYERLQASLQQAAVAAAAARMHAGVYGAAYPSSDQNPYPSLGMDTSAAFYSSLVRHTIHSLPSDFLI